MRDPVRSGVLRRMRSSIVAERGVPSLPAEVIAWRPGRPKTLHPGFPDPREGITGIPASSVLPDRGPIAKSGSRKADAEEGDPIDMRDAETSANDGSTGPTGWSLTLTRTKGWNGIMCATPPSICVIC